VNEGPQPEAGYLVAAGRFRFAAMGIWEPWFYLGAVLFGLSTWRTRREDSAAV
jgi:hypothetical protein